VTSIAAAKAPSRVGKLPGAALARCAGTSGDDDLEVGSRAQPLRRATATGAITANDQDQSAARHACGSDHSPAGAAV
jgi:hypothetical protein